MARQAVGAPLSGFPRLPIVERDAYSAEHHGHGTAIAYDRARRAPRRAPGEHRLDILQSRAAYPDGAAGISEPKGPKAKAGT